MSKTPLSVPDLPRWVSEPAARHFVSSVAGVSAPPGSIDEIRAYYAAQNTQRLKVALKTYDVRVEPGEVSGVPVHMVHPEKLDERGGILLCLHGGGFMWGAGDGAVLEAVPVAAKLGVAVVAADYRLAPEHVFPAAVDDALACYLSLRRAEPGRRVGVYGCSAGGALTAQLVARLLKEGEPVPDAIAMLHGTGIDVGGDSVATTGLLNGLPGEIVQPSLSRLPYLAGARADDPLVFPGEHSEVLAKFPPSMFITGTRDFAASAVTVMHRRLLAQKRVSELVVFDGMWHAHHVDTDLPESVEVFDLMARFFRQHLSGQD